ncbi:uncharacterized protein LOC123317902 [Coccinella septempunctata]|uniref:uncharacterized protein LOC123317902 n=1 Tax=Coccinella septempunctata TaxID=41139 RepID=UPI001D06B967|nr:uncharacterized protein LOC123317902 [Coccinella septempunctata]
MVKDNTLRLGCWNVRSFNSKDQEVILELHHHNIDLCAISETEKKGKGTSQYGEYTMFYSGKSKEVRAASGVGFIIKRGGYLNSITGVKYRSDRILQVSMKTDKEKMNIISLYVPDSGRPTQELEEFYDHLQSTVDDIPKGEKIIMI